MAPGEDDLGIRGMVRTYVFLNDPKVRQVTTKFFAVAVAMGSLFALYALSVTDPGPAGASELAAEGEPATEHTCVPIASYGPWLRDNPQYRTSRVELQADGETVCFDYAPVSGLA